MKIIISPAKKMNIDTDTMRPEGMPIYLQEAYQIKDYLCSMSCGDLQKLWNCNDQIAEENYHRLQNMQLDRTLTPAILAYEGIAYQYMAPKVFEDDQFDYVQENLRILSGFYGVLKPLDGIAPYRLEMQAKTKIEGKQNLYTFWGAKLYAEVIDDSHIIINLASKEYSKCIEKYLQPEDTYITCTFGELVDSKIIQKGVYAKMARGEMVRQMAASNVTDVAMLKHLDILGYHYDQKLSSDDHYIFLK